MCLLLDELIVYPIKIRSNLEECDFMVSLWRWISHKRFYVFEFLILRDIAC